MASPKKQVPLRISSELYNELAAWAEQEFRSVNGQIEYLLHLCLRERAKSGRPIPRMNRNHAETRADE